MNLQMITIQNETLEVGVSKDTDIVETSIPLNISFKMKTIQFIEEVYKTFGHRSINGLYNQCTEVLNTIEMGFIITDFNNNPLKSFNKIDVQRLRHMITRDIIRDFLRSKEVYQMTSIAPIERKSYNWTVVKNRCIKWQIDSVYLGNYLKSKLGWKKKKKNKTKRDRRWG